MSFENVPQTRHMGSSRRCPRSLERKRTTGDGQGGLKPLLETVKGQMSNTGIWAASKFWERGCFLKKVCHHLWIVAILPSSWVSSVRTSLLAAWGFCSAWKLSALWCLLSVRFIEWTYPMWRFLSSFVSKWFTAGKGINTGGLYSESQIHHESCLLRCLHLKRQYLLRWDTWLFQQTTPRPLLWGNNYVKVPTHMTIRWIPWEKLSVSWCSFEITRKNSVRLSRGSRLFFMFFSLAVKTVTIVSAVGLNLSTVSGPRWK